MEIDFTSLSCLKNQRNQNWICQLLRLSRAQHTQVSEKKNIDQKFLGFQETRQLSCQYRVRFARLRETRVTFVIPNQAKSACQNVTVLSCRLHQLRDDWRAVQWRVWHNFGQLKQRTFDHWLPKFHPIVIGAKCRSSCCCVSKVVILKWNQKKKKSRENNTLRKLFFSLMEKTGSRSQRSKFK